MVFIMVIADVYVLSLPAYTEGKYSYAVPASLIPEARIGAFAAVPFGAGNRLTAALIADVYEKEAAAGISLKSLSYIYDGELSLSPEMYELCGFIAENTVSAFQDAVKTVFPTQLLGTIREYYEKTDISPEGLNLKTELVYSAIAAKGRVSAAELTAGFGRAASKILRALTEDGFIRKTVDFDANTNVKEQVFYRLTGAEIPARRSEKVRGALALLSEGEKDKETLAEKTGVTKAQLDSLEAQGIIARSALPKYRNPYPAEATPAVAVSPLSGEQAAAVDTLSRLYATGQPQAALLFGVTGSGKSKVILEMCKKVIAEGRSVILLVPEIALTPQTIAVFSSVAKSRFAVIHSSLSAGERLDAWRRIKRGEVDLVIGTRSAVFAPLSNLGMIVLDEEQEHTYKSEQSPRYHARDVARFRAVKNNALLLLASATPSIESYYKAESGKYHLITLKERYGRAVLPEVIVADLRRDPVALTGQSIGSVLSGHIRETLDRKEQAILFLNRRGYNRYLSCPVCGKVLMCPFCDVSMTYHAHGGRGHLMCHYCGHTAPVPDVCPACGSPNFKYTGFGTQRIEDALSVKFPDAAVLRMDADTVSGKFSHDKILGAFRVHEADILLGTQMVTKGHDFRDVTLVGVILCDSSLYAEDFRAGERTFSLLTQVIGRAGRAEKPGRAVIQTYNPDHDVIRLASKQDYPAFYRGEIKMRRALTFPPFCDLALFSFSSPEEAALLSAVTKFSLSLREMLSKEEHKDVKILCFGPFEAPVYRVKNNYRMQLTAKCRLNKATKALLREVTFAFAAKYPKISLTLDINPYTL